MKVKAALDVLMRFELMNHNVTSSQKDACYGQGFSDNIVIVGQPHWVVWEVAALTQSLLQLGFAIRGGLTVGKVFCGNRIDIGPALVRAVDIEKSIARVPRVVVEQSALQVLEQEQRLSSAMIRKDNDGQSFIDFLALPPSLARARGLSYLECVPAMKVLITDSVAAYRDDPKLLEKYLWLEGYFKAKLGSDGVSNGDRSGGL